MSELIIRKQIEIDTSAESVWTALTSNEFIPQYMFGCRAETDWKPGSPLLWIGAADGKLYVKGQVTAFDEPTLLQYTVIDPNSTIEDIPKNYLTMSFVIKERGADACTLEITQGDFSRVADGKKRYDDTVGGDDFVLAGIKRVAEAVNVAR